MTETQLISIGHDFFDAGNGWGEYSKLKLENKIVDSVKYGNVGEIFEIIVSINEKQKKLMSKNSELERENQILKDQIRKHACFEICEKRLQKYD